MPTTVQGRNVNHENCPTIEASCWVGDFWNLWIFRRLLEKPHRFNDLLESIPEINKSTLSKKLQALVKAKLISREVSPTKPPSVTYTLSAAGQHIKPVIAALEQFGERALETQSDKN